MVIQDTHSDNEKLPPKVVGAQDLNKGLAHDVRWVMESSCPDSGDDKVLNARLARRGENRHRRGRVDSFSHAQSRRR